MTPILTATPGQPPSYNAGMAETFSWIPVHLPERPLYARATYITNASDISISLSAGDIDISAVALKDADTGATVDIVSNNGYNAMRVVTQDFDHSVDSVAIGDPNTLATVNPTTSSLNVTVVNQVSAITVLHPVSSVSITNQLTAITVSNPVTSITVLNPVSAVSITNTVSAVSITNPVTSVTVLNPVSSVSLTNQLTAVTVSNPVTAVNVTNTVEVTPIDEYGWSAEFTPMGEQRFIEPYRVVGTAFEGLSVDSNFWSLSTTFTGVISAVGPSVSLTTGVSANAGAYMNSVRRARYIGGAAMRARYIVQLGDTGTANNIRQWGAAYGAGMPNITDGAYFELSGTTFNVVTERGSTPTKISNGSFNGSLGTTYTLTTAATTYEIYWTNTKVYFVIGDTVLHIVDASSATWSNTLSYYAYLANFNAGNTSNITLNSRTATIYRLGLATTAPRSVYIAGAVTNQVLKVSPGRVQKIVIGDTSAAGTIILYDSLGATNTIFSLSWGNNAGNPVSLPVDVDFYTGLSITTTGGSSKTTIVYE